LHCLRDIAGESISAIPASRVDIGLEGEKRIGAVGCAYIIQSSNADISALGDVRGREKLTACDIDG
jgi:hypothetical protein